jgi:cell division protein ZapD
MEEAKKIIYEQPLNELVRAVLRLEHLFSRIDLWLDSPDVDRHTQTIVSLIVDVLNLLDRPDLKTKLSKEFNRFIINFTRLLELPKVSRNTLEEILCKLKDLKNHFLNTPGKIAQTLRDNEFLASVRHSLLSPGGDSCVDSPGYFYWLNQPVDVRKKQIKIWLNSFAEIRSAVELLLSIVRNSSEPRKIVAVKGFYHEVLDPQVPCQLIRIAIPVGVKLFPEISAGKHRVTVRFVIPSINSRPAQTEKKVKFELTTCVI